MIREVRAYGEEHECSQSAALRRLIKLGLREYRSNHYEDEPEGCAACEGTGLDSGYHGCHEDGQRSCRKCGGRGYEEGA
jgi:hypothetical protein